MTSDGMPYLAIDLKCSTTAADVVDVSLVLNEMEKSSLPPIDTRYLSLKKVSTKFFPWCVWEVSSGSNGSLGCFSLLHMRCSFLPLSETMYTDLVTRHIVLVFHSTSLFLSSLEVSEGHHYIAT